MLSVRLTNKLISSRCREARGVVTNINYSRLSTFRPLRATSIAFRTTCLGVSVGVAMYASRDRLFPRCSEATLVPSISVSSSMLAARESSGANSSSIVLGESDSNKQRTWLEFVQDWIQRIRDYFRISSRFLFCSTVILGTAAVTPVMKLFYSEDVVWSFVVTSIELLGPTFIKMGQWASSRPDLFP